LATFSLSGPRKCSGLPITQYSAAMLDVLFGNTFTLKQAMDVIHVTPSGYEQAFTYTLFQKQS
ncbi:MAG: SAM-dependent methyltransferase, partial [Schleiferiaceae bacterium]|nr:SAM-dependent methyltransferase [Schleiferiaceae bacterium]